MASVADEHAPRRADPASAADGAVARAPWGAALCATSVLFIVAALSSAVVQALAGRPIAYIAWFESATNGVAFTLVGGLVIRRQPGNRTGWLFAGIGAASASQLLAGQYSELAQSGGWPGAEWSALAATVAVYVFLVLGMPLLLLTFPTGRLPSRRWRAFVAVSAIGAVSAVGGVVLRSGEVTGFGVTNPLGMAGAESATAVAENVGYACMFAAVVGGVASLVARWRRAREVERRQLIWFLYAASVGFGTILLASLLLPGLMQGPAGVVIWAFGIASLPVAAGVAILRYRLYDIDRVVSRTLAYTLVTAIIAAPYLIFVPIVTSAVGESDLAVAAATLAAAAAFNPVRRRVQAGVDRRFNRARYDAARTIEEFSSRLRDEVHIEELSNDLLAVVHRTMQPTHASLWLRASS